MELKDSMIESHKRALAAIDAHDKAFSAMARDAKVPATVMADLAALVHQESALGRKGLALMDPSQPQEILIANRDEYQAIRKEQAGLNLEILEFCGKHKIL